MDFRYYYSNKYSEYEIIKKTKTKHVFFYKSAGVHYVCYLYACTETDCAIHVYYDVRVPT